jgi:two-component system, chemotaxis family, sensor kinase CheA
MEFEVKISNPKFFSYRSLLTAHHCFMDEAYLREFLAEAEELIETIHGDVQTLGANLADGRVRRQMIGSIFRHVHTIKGSAAVAGLDELTAIAHEFETLLDAARTGRVSIDDEILQAFTEATNAIAQSLSAASAGETKSASDTGRLIERLRKLAEGGRDEKTSNTNDAQTNNARRADDVQSIIESLPADIARGLSEQERHRLTESIGEGASLFIVSVSFDLQVFDEQFRQLTDALGDHGDIVSTLPGVEESAPDRIAFRVLYTTPESFEQTVRHTKEFDASLDLVSPSTSAEPAANVPPTTTDAKNLKEEAFAPIASLTTLVRVPLDELDDLISATDELFTDTMQTIDAVAYANDEFARASTIANAQKSETEIKRARIRRRFIELEERLIELRMIPVARTLERAARVGQTAARGRGKEIEFETIGGEVRLDKSLADRVADPLLHLLRNAVDHGIEPVEERARAGKPLRGRVRLEAVSEGSRVRLRIEDDGGGINIERVRLTAIERGIISESEEVGEQQALRLIFSPGFSTAQGVTNLSGRGVGLDVVERTVESIGGELRVRSRAGAGTVFEMLLPTTLALVPSMMVHSGGYRYCIDAAHIVEAGYVQPAEVERIGRDAHVTRWRDTILPFVHLRELLAQTPFKPENDERLPIIIARRIGSELEANATSLEQAAAWAAVAVDDWSGHREVLVRGLGSYATRWRGVSGATELRDGTIALMLDLPRLLEMRL